MSHERAAKGLAAAPGAISLFAASAAIAQRVQQQPAASTTYPVHFATGSSQLDGADQDTISGVAAMMQRTPSLVATIIGKSDAAGSAELNEHLAQKRGEAVFEALVYTNKVPENKVELRWNGEHLPFVSTEDEQAEAQNRVVAIILR